MDYIMITFKFDNNNKDLKVPVFITVTELLEILFSIFNISSRQNCKLQAEPMGLILDNDKTLEQQSVLQGSLLTLV